MAEGAKAAAAARAGGPAKPAKAVKAAKAAKSAKQTKPVKAAKAGKAAEPDKPTRSAKPRSAKPTSSAKPPKSAEPTKAAESAKPGKAAGPARVPLPGVSLPGSRTAGREDDGPLTTAKQPPLEAKPIPFAQPANAQVPTVAPWTLDQQSLFSLQNEYVSHASNLMNQFASGRPPALKDRRFSGKAWSEHPQFAWQAAWYLLNSDYLQKTAELISADKKTVDRIRFLTQQWIDACSPANFFASNPEAQSKLLETGGDSLRAGIGNLLGDIGQGRISQTDLNAFEVGRNVGTTTGGVVFENELVQLIQYEPTTPTVGARPLLVVPPSINKYYILDLQPENSFIAHSVAGGNTVFLISWRNVKRDQGKLTWDDYLQLGVVDSIGAVQAITGQKTVNMLGFCVGGTILCTALAALAARGERPAASLTLLTTLLDFADPGTLGIFVDEMHVAMREQAIGSGGIMSGTELATTFSTLRPKDLVWNYVVNNYLKGESPPPFDLLYWNSDSANLPGPMFCWYLRYMYLQNDLRVPGRLTALGQPLDLGSIDVPTYLLCTIEDHIVPWQGGFVSAQTLSGERRFVLGASGHIAGVINPPAPRKRSYRTGPEVGGLEAEDWLAQSVEHPGSWWTDWLAWIAKYQGPKVPAPKAPGDAAHPVIEPAPGRYVKEKAN